MGRREGGRKEGKERKHGWIRLKHLKKQRREEEVGGGGVKTLEDRGRVLTIKGHPHGTQNFLPPIYT